MACKSPTSYVEDCIAGRVFSQQNTPLGLAIPIYTATAIAGAMPVWNPPNSGAYMEPIEINIARTSGTADFAAIGLMIRKVDAIATGSVMTAMAETTPSCGIFARGFASRMRSSNAGTVTVTAGVAAEFIRNLFTINLEADTGTAHATTAAKHVFNGTLIIPPGYMMYLAGTKASVALYSSTIVWREITVP